MQHKNIILNSLKDSFKLIWKNKSLFFLLFILQVLFFYLLFLISINYQTKILENAKAMSDYISQLELNDVSIASNILQQKNILGDDPLAISRNFNEMVENFRIYLIYIFALLAIFTSISWALTYKLIYKISLKKLIKPFLKIFLVSSSYLLLIFLFFFSLFNISFTEAAVEASKLFAKYIPFLIFSIILFYFMFVSVSLLHNTALKNIVQKTLIIGIKKIHYVLAVYIINIFLFGIFIILLYYFIEKNLFILSLSLMLIVFCFVFGRILLVKVVEKLLAL